jgi:hypothetical protein
LRSLRGKAAEGYDYQARPAERAVQLRALRASLGLAPAPDRKQYPDLPLTADGRPSDEFERLLRTRKDPDVYIHE